MTSWNELVYMKCVLPQLLKIADKIVIVDDSSNDGTVEWVKSLNDPRIDLFTRKFTTCAEQNDAALQRCTKDNTWVWCTSPDELPTQIFIDTVRTLLNEADKRNIDRIWAVVYHMRGLDTMSEEVGMEIKLFRNDEHHKCHYTGFPHERIDGVFDGTCEKADDGRFGICHMKQADKAKCTQWKTDYVEKLIYSAKDINRRLKYRTVSKPHDMAYYITDELKDYICSQ
jgi:glycosyltransferase involved in cell wall biosynthesis